MTDEKNIAEVAACKGRVVGIDFGDKRTGLAISDASRFLASGVETISVGGIVKTADAVAEFVKKNNASAIIVGLPINMDGSQGFRAERVKEFAQLLKERVEIPIALYDERMTTMAATRFLNKTDTKGKKRKDVIDTLSAQIILQNFLDFIKNCKSN